MSGRALGSSLLCSPVLPLPRVDQVDQNDRSVGVVMRFGRFAAFLSGDSERPFLSHFLDHDLVPDVTFSKAVHRGSRGGFTDASVAACAAYTARTSR